MSTNTLNFPVHPNYSLQLTSDYNTIENTIYNQEIRLDIHKDYLEYIGLQIIKEELKTIKDIDLEKINDLLNSGDYEQFNLVFIILDTKTKYAQHLIKAIYQNDIYTLTDYIRKYMENNRLNISSSIIK